MTDSAGLKFDCVFLPFKTPTNGQLFAKNAQSKSQKLISNPLLILVRSFGFSFVCKFAHIFVFRKSPYDTAYIKFLYDWPEILSKDKSYYYQALAKNSGQKTPFFKSYNQKMFCWHKNTICSHTKNTRKKSVLKTTQTLDLQRRSKKKHC